MTQAGRWTRRTARPPPEKRCLDSFEWGPPLGTLAGVALATALDAVYLANVERPVAVTSSSTHGLSALPALAVDPGGHLTLSLAGRF